jgi:hypothetical protein
VQAFFLLLFFVVGSDYANSALPGLFAYVPVHCSVENITLAQFSAKWFVWGRCDYVKSRLDKGTSIGKTCAEGCRRYIEKFIIPTFGRLKLSKITRPANEKWQINLLENGLSAGTSSGILTDAEVKTLFSKVRSEALYGDRSHRTRSPA